MKLDRRPLWSSWARAKGAKRIFKDHSRSVALAVAFRLDTITTRWSLLSAFNAPLPTCYNPLTRDEPGGDHVRGLLRQPVFVRFRAFNGLETRDASAVPELEFFDASAATTSSLSSVLIACA